MARKVGKQFKSEPDLADFSRNGYSSQTLKGDRGEVEINTPRDRNGTFEPQLIRKGQTRLAVCRT